MNIIKEYDKHCQKYNIPFKIDSNILSYDDSTLFCPAGMQQFKSQFRNINYKGQTIANIQSCLRLTDLNSIGDGNHLLYFNMMGLFSFRNWTIEQSIKFWLEFIEGCLDIKIDKVTIHPDRKEWSKFYKKHSWNYSENFVKEDIECKWSDGEIGGYCTEFFHKNIEIGNIVNPLDNCIDVGFGFERIDFIVNNTKPKTYEEVLIEVIQKIIDSKVKPSNTKQGYVLRKLLRLLYTKNISFNHPYYFEEIKRQEKLLDKYNKLKNKFPDKSKEWWFDTHGIDLSLIKYDKKDYIK